MILRPTQRVISRNKVLTKFIFQHAHCFISCVTGGSGLMKPHVNHDKLNQLGQNRRALIVRCRFFKMHWYILYALQLFMTSDPKVLLICICVELVRTLIVYGHNYDEHFLQSTTFDNKF